MESRYKIHFSMSQINARLFLESSFVIALSQLTWDENTHHVMISEQPRIKRKKFGNRQVL